MLNKPTFSVEPITLMELGQQNNQFLSKLHWENWIASATIQIVADTIYIVADAIQFSQCR